MHTINADLLETIKNHLIETYKPLRIFLFGSYAWGEPNMVSILLKKTQLTMILYITTLEILFFFIIICLVRLLQKSKRRSYGKIHFSADGNYH